MLTGSQDTTLIVIRGNSGSGKSTVAHAVREAYGRRGMAVISQDVVRRDILRELDRPGGVNIGLLDVMCRHALDAGYHVILEGILAGSRYGQTLQALCRDHRGRTLCYYLDVSWEETLRRHETRPQRARFGPEEMLQWYVKGDVLPDVHETIIGESSPLEEIVQLILQEAGLLVDETVRSASAQATATPQEGLPDRPAIGRMTTMGEQRKEPLVDESIAIVAPARDVWQAIVIAEIRAGWWGHLDLDATAGGRFEERWTDDGGRQARTSGKVIEVVADHLLVLSWADEGWSAATRAEIQLTEIGGSTMVRILHTGWGALPDGAALAAQHRAGWLMHLADLRRYVEDSAVF
ncbi:SRPBCC domain-containing protein [Nonomuraea turcica]|uniref:SRPBCC domain-containing protein n=1 Tax=Nonomuraea sp. G32 TaxID=3067274 RepID=UPI00273BA84F|nr:SRPBCC domain-containing protein [Nonomuraea sp. G32]MDP4506783.1 SRPBCC domain-containing protein [Nonomuraea sp. G32]